MSSSPSKPHRRVPQCARCRSHNVFSNVRGHKKVCQWKDCTCAKCQMVKEKRRITAVRVAVLRQERKRRMTSRRLSYQMGAWSMMGNIAGSYAAEHFVDNRHLLIETDPDFTPDIFHHTPPFPAFHCPSLYPDLRGDNRDGSGVKDSSPQDIDNSVRNFEQEYLSLMRKQHDVMLPGDRSRDQHADRGTHTQCPRAMFDHPPPLYITNPRGHEHPYSSPAVYPQESHRIHSPMLDVPPTLLCAHSVTRPRLHRMPFGF